MELRIGNVLIEQNPVCGASSLTLPLRSCAALQHDILHILLLTASDGAGGGFRVGSALLLVLVEWRWGLIDASRKDFIDSIVLIGLMALPLL